MEYVHNKNHTHVSDETGPYAFISYSHADFNIVEKYLDSLTSICRFWFDEGIKSGAEWIKEIGDKIFNCEVFIVFLSNSAIQSHFIKSEISYAYKYAKKMIAVFLEPVRLDRGLDFILTIFQHIEYKKENSTTDNINKILSCLPENILLTTPDLQSEDDEFRSFSKEDATLEGELTSTQIFRDLYSIQKLISRGGVGEVYSVKSKRTGAEYIMKKQHIENETSDRFKRCRSIARNELEKLLILNERPYTPVLIDYMEDTENSYLIMSLMQGVTLNELFEKKILSNSDEVISLVFKVALILQDVQQHNLVYGDVKPSNFIIDSFGQIGLIDFGSTYALNDSLYIKTFTPHYAAPELTNNDDPGLKFSYDVYALGIMFSELLLNNNGIEYTSTPLTDKIMSKMTAESSKNRYQTIGEVVAALELIVPENYDSILRSLARSAETRTSTDLDDIEDYFNSVSSQEKHYDTEYFTHIFSWNNDTIAIPKKLLEEDESRNDPNVVQSSEDSPIDYQTKYPTETFEDF